MKKEISLNNPYLGTPTADNENYRRRGCMALGKDMLSVGINGIIAESPPSDGHAIGTCVVLTCMRMPNCELRHVVELVAPHRFRPAHAAGGGGGPTIHGAVWTATRMIGLDLPDDVFWTDVVRKVLCPWKRPSASLYFDCMHGVGHGGIMRATAVVKLRKLNKGSEPTALELLEYALGFCAASTNRHLAHDCSVGAYMGGYTDKAAAELVASGQLTAHFSAPCGHPGLRFTATCFQHVFYGMASKPGASAASDVCLNQLAEVDGLATEDLRIGCLVAQANIFFPRYDGYILERSSKVVNTSNTRSRLTFLQGSGYVDGVLLVDEASATCDTCANGAEKPSSLRKYCEGIVGAYYVNGAEVPEDIDPVKRRRWLACVAGSMMHGENGLVNDVNVANAVDGWDVPAYVVRRVCDQLRFGPPGGVGAATWELGYEAAALCEKAALYQAVTSAVTFEEYASWPLEIMDGSS